MNKEKLLKASKILVIIFMSLTFLNILLPDEFVIGIKNLTYRPDAFQMILRWMNFVAFLALPVAVYFDKNIFKKISIYFCLPVAIIFMCTFGDVLPGYMSELGTGIVDIRYLPDFVSSFMHNGVFRGIVFFAMNLSGVATTILLIIRDWEVIKFKKADILPFIIILVCLIASIVPIYALEGIFYTDSNIKFKFFEPAHFVWIAFVILETYFLIRIFKKRSEEDRYILVLILSLALLVQYNQLFSSLGELTCKRMPLQLCNLAAYLTLISIVTKNRSIYLFNILVNVAGGIIALLILDADSSGLISKGNIHYIVEHNNVIVVPILCLFLGIFKPLTKKDFKTFAIYFTAYFVIIFILGTTFNALAKGLDSDYFKCNYLFMFDQVKAAKLIPFAGDLFNIKIEIGAVTIYPVIQLLVYITFFLIGTLSFFIFKKAVKEKEEVAELVTE